MATFRPSARARLQLRLDEGTDTEPLRERLEQSPPDGATVADTLPATEIGRDQELDRNRARRRLVLRERASLSPSELSERTGRLDQRRNALQLGSPEQQSKPQGLSRVTGDDLTVGVDVVPLSVRIERNGLMEADTAELVFDHRVAPIDPRILRAVFLDVLLGTVSADEFELGTLGGTIDGEPLSLVQRVPGATGLIGGTRFVGYVDEWHTKEGPEGDTVKVRARDMTAPLIDQRLPTGLAIDMTRPLADGVQDLVDYLPATRGLKVVFGSPNAGPDLRGERGPVPADAIPRSRKARKGRSAKRVKSGDTSMSMWDHIVDTVVATGYLPIVRGLALYLIEPRTFYQGRDRAKRLVYGRNLLDLEFARKLGGAAKVPTIEVRCADPDIGATRWARAPKLANQRSSGVFGRSDPPKAARPNDVSPGGSTQEQIRVIPVSGITDAASLERVAQSLYEQIGRQEIEGSWSTDDITSFEGNEGDLLDLQAGDPVEILIAPLNAATTGDSTNTEPGGSVTSAQELESMVVSRRKRFLRGLGYSERAAERLALAQEQTALNTVFRSQNLTIEFSQEDGVHIEGDFINFIVARESAGAATQQSSAAVAAATFGNRGAAAAAVAAASAAGNQAGADAKAGELSPPEYSQRSSEERGRQQRATQALRRDG